MGSKNGPEPGSTSPYWFWYSIDESEHESNSLTIDEEGTATANITITEENDPLRALGAFRLKLDANDPDRRLIGDLIRSRGLIGGDVFAQPPSFGGRSVIFQIRADGMEVTHDLNPMAPLPPAFREVEAVVERLFARVASGPLRALSMDVSVEPEQLKPGGKLQINLEFRNSGRFGVSFRNPVPLAKAGNSYLRFNLWKPERDEEGEVNQELAATLDLHGREFLTAERRAVSSSVKSLHLSPNETLRMWTTVKLPRVQPGQYTLEAIYYAIPVSSSELEEDNDLVAGEYHAELRMLHVVER